MRSLQLFLLGLLSTLLSGCIARQNPSQAARLNVWMTRWADVVQHRPIPRTAFTKSDRPTAVLQNLDLRDQTVYVEFIHVDSDKSVFHEGTGIAPKEVRVIGPTQPLATGNYYLKVTPQNSAPLMQAFAIYGD